MNWYSYWINNPLLNTDKSGETYQNFRLDFTNIVWSNNIRNFEIWANEFIKELSRISWEILIEWAITLAWWEPWTRTTSKILGKSKKVEKKISKQKQNKHIKGTKENEQATKNWENKSTWKNSNDADKLTKEAYEKWTPVPWKPYQKIYETNKEIWNNWETKIKVHDSKTWIYWHPNK